VIFLAGLSNDPMAEFSPGFNFVAHPNEFPAKVPRPLYSVLANQGLQEHGLDILRPWREGLAEYFASR